MLGSRTKAAGRLNLPEIGRAVEKLRATVASDPKSWKVLRREAFDATVEERLLEGYAYVDRLLAEGVDPFAYGNSKHLLELNHLVLCGSSAEVRAQSKSHIERTHDFFHKVRLGGIGDFSEWYACNSHEPAPRLAAGCLAVIASSPQLFIEGNQRTATLIASLLLVRSGLPPLVVTADNFRLVLPLFARAKAIDRSSWTATVSLLLLRHRLQESYGETAEPRFVRPAG